MTQLDVLLRKASCTFRDKDWKKAKLTSYDFSLNKFPYGWVFGVVNDWNKWLEKELEYDFGTYKRPEDAVLAFLDYVKLKKINVRKLMS